MKKKTRLSSSQADAAAFERIHLSKNSLLIPFLLSVIICACGAAGNRYNASGAISLAQPCPKGQWGQKEVVPMEQFLLDVLAGVVAGRVLIIGRKLFRK